MPTVFCHSILVIHQNFAVVMHRQYGKKYNGNITPSFNFSINYPTFHFSPITSVKVTNWKLPNYLGPKNKKAQQTRFPSKMDNSLNKGQIISTTYMSS